MWYFLHFHILILWFSVFDTLSISLPSSKLTNSLISIYRHYTIDIADPNSMLEACHMNFVIDFAHQEVSVVRRSEVRFLMETPNFFFGPRPWQDEKHLSLHVDIVFQDSELFIGTGVFNSWRDAPTVVWNFWASVAEFWRNSVIFDILENKSMFSLTKYTVIYFPLRPT